MLTSGLTQPPFIQFFNNNIVFEEVGVDVDKFPLRTGFYEGQRRHTTGFSWPKSNKKKKKKTEKVVLYINRRARICGGIIDWEYPPRWTLSGDLVSRLLSLAWTQSKDNHFMRMI